MSDLESAFREELERLAPDEQFVFNVRIPTGPDLGDSCAYRKPDVFHEPSGMICELDGFYYHEADKDRASDDKLRDRVLRRAGYQTIRFSGDQIRDDAEACVREYLEFCGIQIKESNSMKYPVSITTEQFEAVGHAETDITFCQTGAEAKSIGLGCLVSARATYVIRNIYTKMDPGFSSDAKSRPAFELVSDSDKSHGKHRQESKGRHYLLYTYHSDRLAVYMTEEQHAAIRPYTEAFDKFKKEATTAEEYLDEISKLPRLDITLWLDPEHDHVYRHAPEFARSSKSRPAKTYTKTSSTRKTQPKKTTDYSIGCTEQPSIIPPNTSNGSSPVSIAPKTIEPKEPVASGQTKKQKTDARWSRDKAKAGRVRDRQADILAASAEEISMKRQRRS